MSERTYDEKFHILQAPSLFLDDLAYYRAKCELRNLGLVAAALDIDGFKQFNARLGKPIVDRDILPRFMRALEAHVFGRGYTYRFGGDEYMMLLPNTNTEAGCRFLVELQARLMHIDYPGIDNKPTLSIGVCHVDQDCFLTEQEVAEKAIAAEEHAKRKGGNRIAAYKASLYREQDLCVYDEETK